MERSPPHVARDARVPRSNGARSRKLVVGMAAMGLGFGAYYALTALYPTVLRTELGVDARGVAWLVALFNIGMLAGSVACGVLASRRGVALAIVAPALLSVLALPLYVGIVPRLLGVGAFAGGALGAGFCGVVPMFLTGMFAAEVRARFVGIVYHVGAALAALVPPATAALSPGRAHRPRHGRRSRRRRCEVALAVAVLAGRRHVARRSRSLNRPSSRCSKPPERDPRRMTMNRRPSVLRALVLAGAQLSHRPARRAAPARSRPTALRRRSTPSRR